MSPTNSVSGEDLEDHPDQLAEEEITALSIFLKKLDSALQEKNLETIEYQQALIEARLAKIAAINESLLTAGTLTKLKKAVEEATSKWQSVEQTLSLARTLSKSTTTIPAPPSTENHTRVQWKWSPVPFHGKVEDWMNWWATFSTSIHNDATLANEWKMKALIECLKGPAEDVLGKMERTGENYSQAITLLQNRFGDPLALSKAYNEQLENLLPATDLKSQQQTLDKLIAIVRNLTALSDKIKIDENYVTRQICQKFSPELLRWAIHGDLEQQNPEMRFTPSELLQAIEKTMKVEMYIATQLSEEDSASSSSKKAVGVLAVGSKRPSESSRSCTYCSLSHNSADCRRFSTVIARRNRLVELQRCVNCTKSHKGDCNLPPSTCGRCHKQHHTILCITNLSNKRKKQGKIILFSSAYLQTFICQIKNQKTGKVFSIRGILDQASDNSFILHTSSRKLGLPVGKDVLLDCLRFAESGSKLVNGYYVTITIMNFDNQSKTIDVISTPCIVGDLKTCLPPDESLEILPLDLEYADPSIFLPRQNQIELLIGADFYHSFVNIRESYELANGINMIKTFFGWLPSGAATENDIPIKKSRLSSSLVTSVKKNSTIDTFSSDFVHGPEVILDDINLELMWRLEILGIESPEKEIEKGLEYVLDMYRKTTYVDHLDRKNVRIPWKDLKTVLPSNFRVAFARLKGLVEKTPMHVLKLGDEHFKQQELEGIIEDAPPLPKLGILNIGDERSRVHYMPHRWLFQKGKIRVVYDGSAPTKSGASLNNMIYQGCNLTTNIVRLLLNFRLFKVALVADIEKAFLQISLNEVDRDATRFLWVKDITKPVTDSNLVYKRFARLPMGLNVSPYILNMVLTDTFNEQPLNRYLKDGQQKFYADNLVTSMPTHNDALNLFSAMTKRLSSIKMNLRDWATNDKIVAAALPPEKLDTSPDPISVLGLPWTRSEDFLNIKLDIEKPLLGTKRNVLKFYASIFDPLGLVAPCVLDLKIFIQKCWKLKYDWNTLLPPQLNAEWLKYRTEASRIPQIPIERHYFPNVELGTYDIHIFCDASQKAYACCAYLVYSNSKTMTTFSRLIFSKVRISPPNILTIPKLELMAVLIGKRTAAFLRTNLEVPINQVKIWTDATTVLQWLASTDILAPFIQNRLTEIRQADRMTIRFTPTNENPADCATRGQSVNLLENNNLWWFGPTWLTQEMLWPKPPLNVENFDSSIPRLNTVTLVTQTKPYSGLLSTAIENNFRTWTSRIKVFYHVIKFCFLRSNQPFYATDLEATNVAEKLLIIELQHKYFAKEIEILKKGGQIRNNLGLFLDDKGIIRCRGRLHYAKFPWETKHPIFLPRESVAIFSLIKEIHNKNEHIGVAHTLAKLRENFWISKGRAKVKSVINSCYKCRFWFGGSYPLPSIPPLPEARVADVTPFLQIGIDYFGPLHIKNAANEIIDVQVLIFTCLVTRAIHLELVPDLTGEQFLMALERFCSLKRVPKLIISDNGKTFVFVQPFIGIKVRIRDHKINDFLTSNRVEWYFIPQYAPWFGGAYERLIAIIKKCLKISYGKTLLTYMELQTVIYKIADILNGRPLTYISDEVIEPLTPNHFLKLGPTNINLELDLTPKPPLSATGAKLVQKWEVLSRILDGYWDAFRHLYLQSLRDIHKTHHTEKKGVATFTPKVGDHVLIQETSMPRAYWKFGRVERLDKRQAVAHVKCKGDLLIRSIRHLFPLEAQRARPSEAVQAPACQ